MTNMLCESAFFGVVISLLAYELGMLLKKKFGLPIFNPLLISIAVVIVFLAVFDIDYQNYNDGAKYLSYLLTPATVCLAIPLYEQMEALKKNIKAILAGILSGVLTSLTVVLALALIFNLNHKMYVTLLPKSITTAIGMGLVLAMLAWAWRGAEMKPMALVEQGGNILTLISDFFPPDFTDWRMYVEEMIVTLHVAIWGTLLAVICAVPLGIMSSANIAPWWICQPVRRLMDAARAINEMVFAMMFVVAVGLGPFAAIMAAARPRIPAGSSLCGRFGNILCRILKRPRCSGCLMTLMMKIETRLLIKKSAGGFCFLL